MKNLSLTLVGFTPYWDYKPTNAFHADGPGSYTMEKDLNLGTVGKIRLKCDGIWGSIVAGSREPILFSFVLDETPG